MAKITEIYKKRLLANYTSLLLILGLKTGSDDIPVYDFLVDSRSKFNYYYSDKKSFKNNRIRLESSVAELAKISDSASFSYMSILDFSSYERIDYLLDLILNYQDVNSVTSYMDDDIKKLIEYLTLLESTNGAIYKNTLSYMTLRNFLMFLVNKHFLHASVYANFIKEQIFLSVGLSPKMKFTDIYKGELGLSIKRERSRYSNKIRRLLKDQVTSIVKNSKGPKVSDDKEPNNYRTSSKEDLDNGINSSETQNGSNMSEFKGKVISVINSKTHSRVGFKDFKSKIDSMVNNRNIVNNKEQLHDESSPIEETFDNLKENNSVFKSNKSKVYSNVILEEEFEETKVKHKDLTGSRIFDEDKVMDGDFTILKEKY